MKNGEEGEARKNSSMMDEKWKDTEEVRDTLFCDEIGHHFVVRFPGYVSVPSDKSCKKR